MMKMNLNTPGQFHESAGSSLSGGAGRTSPFWAWGGGVPCERTNKRVDLTPVGSQILTHAQEALSQAAQMEAVARAARDPLVGPLKLGVIPTVAPYLMPLILKPLRQGYPGLTIELWEDQTRALVEGLRNHKLDAALLATETDAPEITEIELYEEPLLAALPRNHRLAGAKKV